MGKRNLWRERGFFGEKGDSEMVKRILWWHCLWWERETFGGKRGFFVGEGDSLVGKRALWWDWRVFDGEGENLLGKGSLWLEMGVFGGKRDF